MTEKIRKAGVIGTGVMGAQIAALLAGAGLDVELLDVVPGGLPLDADVRIKNRLSIEALVRLPKSRPSALYSRTDLSHIRGGNLEDHIQRLSDCDWVIEAVIERVDIKRALYARLDGVLSESVVLSSNTSGILRSTLTEGMRAAQARHFCITHFFNPPRHMKLLEVIAEGVDPQAIQTVVDFCRRRLGKGVVLAKDTPLFIANRIGVFYVLDVMHRLVEQGWPIEAVDAVLSHPTARPKTGVFRTVDMAGIDTLAFVAAELVKGCPDDEGIDRCRIPQFLQQMIMKGFVGNKAGRGFYFKDKETGRIQSFDPAMLDYRAHINFSTPALVESAGILDPAKRLCHTVFADDQAGEIAWPVISSVITYAANRIPEIADDVASVDDAMRWGYHWELGPFETWDALGVKETAVRLEDEGVSVPRIVEDLLRKGFHSFYEWRGRERAQFNFGYGKYENVSGSEKCVKLARLKKIGCLVDENAVASIIDIGDGIFVCEFHSKMNAIDGDVVAMLDSSLDRVQRDGVGLLIANEGEHFSVGANLLLLLMAAGQKRWDEIDAMVRGFQGVNQRIRFAKRPVLVVPFGMTLGGGCEICLAANRRVAFIESYIGLVEAGAGLIPAGAGCKNLILALEKRTGMALGPQPKVSAAFELIALAKTSGSAREAVEFGFLSKDDSIIMDRDLLLYEAKVALLEWAESYEPPLNRADVMLPGRGGEMALWGALRGFVAQGKATEHDALVAKKLAHVLSGGDASTIHETCEDHILELEREAFLSLIAEPKTQERITHLLKTGKPLRN